jgi:hypothetical protein
MQLSNEPAEALAKKLVETSNGAFSLCGFASGGNSHFPLQLNMILNVYSRIGSYGGRYKTCKTGSSFSDFTSPPMHGSYFLTSISSRLVSPKEPTSLPDNYHSTETHLERSPWHIIQFAVSLMLVSSMTNISTTFLLLMPSDSKSQRKLKNNTLSAYDRNWKTNLSSSAQIR